MFESSGQGTSSPMHYFAKNNCAGILTPTDGKARLDKSCSPERYVVMFKAAILILIAFSLTANAAPPVAGGFLSGNDGSLYLFWYHRQINGWEKVCDTGESSMPFIIGRGISTALVAQQQALPWMSYTDSFYVRVHQGDMFPNFPGNQFSPFRYRIYETGIDSLPPDLPLTEGIAALCGGNPCSDSWAAVSAGLMSFQRRSIWVGLGWEDSLPEAPQMMWQFPLDAADYNVMGFVSGDEITWQEIDFAPMIRAMVMTTWPCDTAKGYVKYSGDEFDITPDSFQILAYSGMVIDTLNILSETLLCRLPRRMVDSASVSACYENMCDANGLMLLPWGKEALPLRCELIAADFEEDTLISCHASITNTSEMALAIVLDYDRSRVNCDQEIFVLTGGETWLFQFQTTAIDTSETIVVPFLFTTESGSSMPFLWEAEVKPTGQTDVREREDLALPHRYLLAYPNPTTGMTHFKISGAEYSSGSLIIYNLLGQRVSEVRTDRTGMGTWNGCDGRGTMVSKGIYFVRAGGVGGPVAKIIRSE